MPWVVPPRRSSARAPLHRSQIRSLRAPKPIVPKPTRKSITVPPAAIGILKGRLQRRIGGISLLRGSLLRRRLVGSSVSKSIEWLGGPETVKSTGPPLDLNEDLPWFPEFKGAAFAISIRPHRWEGLKARLGPWARDIQLWTGTNGEGINISRWTHNGTIAHGSQLNRGQIGCYDSHVRVWSHVVDNKLDMALVLEDDANVRYTKAIHQAVRKGLDEAKSIGSWDLLYLGRSRLNIQSRVSNTMVRPKGCCGLFAYVVSQTGAQKLLRSCRPYRVPVDVLVCNMHDTNRLSAIAIDPRLCYVVPVRSDTRNIK